MRRYPIQLEKIKIFDFEAESAAAYGGPKLWGTFWKTLVPILKI